MLVAQKCSASKSKLDFFLGIDPPESPKKIAPRCFQSGATNSTSNKADALIIAGCEESGFCKHITDDKVYLSVVIK